MNKVGIIASIQRVLVTICSSLIKTCTLLDTTLDAAQDVADSGKIITSQLKQETQINADAEISALKAFKVV